MDKLVGNISYRGIATTWLMFALRMPYMMVLVMTELMVARWQPANTRRRVWVG